MNYINYNVTSFDWSNQVIEGSINYIENSLFDDLEQAKEYAAECVKYAGVKKAKVWKHEEDEEGKVLIEEELIETYYHE